MSYQDKQLKKEFITVDNRTIPFGYPQFWGGDDWEVSGRDNPLPVANYTQNEQGLWVPVSNENPVPTQLTGSNVDQITVVDALALTDVNNVASANVDLTNYKKIMFFVVNTHDAEIRLRVQYNLTYIRYFDFEEGEIVSTLEKGIIIPNFSGSSQRYFLNQESVLTSLPLRGNVRFLINAVTTPTQGSLTIGLIGGVL